MAVDASMRKLMIPPRFMPYLEKHRIYELFHDLGNELAMVKPKDELKFLKTLLERLNTGRDRRLIIILAPPYLDRIKLAHLISVRTGCGLLSRHLVSGNRGNYYDPNELATNTLHTIESSEVEGWVLADYPDTEEEAQFFINSGVLPTHVFVLQPDESKSKNQENKYIHTVDATTSMLLAYDNSTHRLRELFKSSLKVVKIKNRSLEEIANLCMRSSMKMPRCHAPKLFRVALIGPRGSRRRTLAKLLVQRFNLVHIDMDHLINAARTMENDLGDEIRALEKYGYPYTMKIISDLLKSRLFQRDCLDRGYLLTNFPCSLEDFVLLDSTDMPPNRVIFLDIDGSACQSRLEDRVVNMYTGSLHSKKLIKKNTSLKSQTLTHPDDESCKVEEEIKFYNQRVQAMMDYCGKTCAVVDARGPIPTLLERVEAVLMNSSPAAKPRTGKLLPRSSIRERQSDASSENIVVSYPMIRTQVVPLIDSADLLRRFQELKENSHKQNNIESPSTTSAEVQINDVVSNDPGDPTEKDSIRVKRSELPVEEWYQNHSYVTPSEGTNPTVSEESMNQH